MGKNKNKTMQNSEGNKQNNENYVGEEKRRRKKNVKEEEIRGGRLGQ